MQVGGNKLTRVVPNKAFHATVPALRARTARERRR